MTASPHDDEAAPTLADAQQAAAELFTALSAAGKQSKQEHADGHTHPSEAARSLWGDAAEKLMELVGPVLHLADGGEYDNVPPDTAEDDDEDEDGAGAASESTFEVDPDKELTDFHKSLTRRTGNGTNVTLEEARAALAAFHHAVRVEGEPLRFVSNPGRTGISAFEWLVHRYGSMKKPSPLEHPRALELASCKDVLRILNWVDPAVAPQRGEWVTETDVNAMYLSAAHSVLLGDDAPDELDAAAIAALDQKTLVSRPGWLRLATTPDLSHTPRHVQLAFASLEADKWLITPYAAYLARDHQVTLQFDEAVIWGEDKKGKRYGPRLARWAKSFVDGRRTLLVNAASGQDPNGSLAAEHAAKILKLLYSTFLGGLLRSDEHNDKGTLRPDWADQIMGLAGANMLRALDKAAAKGFHPMGGMRDSVWWTSTPDQTPLQPAGMEFPDQHADKPFQVGKWSTDRHGPVTDELIAAHATGSAPLLKKQIIRADDQRREQEK